VRKRPRGERCRRKRYGESAEKRVERRETRENECAECERECRSVSETQRKAWRSESRETAVAEI